MSPAVEESAAERPVVASPRGPLSALVLDLLRRSPMDAAIDWSRLIEEARRLVEAVEDPPRDDDLQLALYACFEQHYRGLPGADPEWEWSPGLLAVRAPVERAFLDAVGAEVGPGSPVEPGAVGDLLFELEAADDGASLSQQVERHADLDQFREVVVHRSLYQLKEADPHSWAIPRLRGPAKAALLEVQSDEYGSGRPERMHSTLFAKTMRQLGLREDENAYLNLVPGVTLATVNLMSALGLSRARRGALVGHLAMFEMTSARPNSRYGNALRRLGFGPEATDFYDEHVEADAVHENIAAYDLAGGLARQEPRLAGDIVFGARALLHLEDSFARHVIAAWEDGRTSLRAPL